jgi:hypothetical protein
MRAIVALCIIVLISPTFAQSVGKQQSKPTNTSGKSKMSCWPDFRVMAFHHVLCEWRVRYFGAEVPPVAAPGLRPMFGEAFVGPAPLVTVS